MGTFLGINRAPKTTRGRHFKMGSPIYPPSDFSPHCPGAPFLPRNESKSCLGVRRCNPHKLAAVDWEANVAVVEPAESVWERLRRFCAEHDPELAAAEEETPPVTEARSEPGDGLMIRLPSFWPSCRWRA